jgi:hypothetical protein
MATDMGTAMVSGMLMGLDSNATMHEVMISKVLYVYSRCNSCLRPLQRELDLSEDSLR